MDDSTGKKNDSLRTDQGVNHFFNHFTLELSLMGTTADTLRQLQQEALSGGLGNASAETLDAYAAVLCHSQAFSHFGAHEFPQICETVRIHLLRAHIARLQAHITALDAKNTKLSWLVVVLTVASLFGAGGQIWFAYKADKKSEQTSLSVATQPQKPAPQSSSPIAPARHPDVKITPAPKQP